MRLVFTITDKTSVLLALAGIVFYYSGPPWVVYLCAGALMLHSILNCKYGGQNNLGSEITTYFVGAIVALVLKIPFWPCVAVAYCYAELLFTIPALFLMIHYLITGKSKK